MVFAAGVEIPSQWDCPRCGRFAFTEDQPEAAESADRGRTHWDMLLERRTLEELDAMLADKIDQLRAL
jgi:rubredoxin